MAKNSVQRNETAERRPPSLPRCAAACSSWWTPSRRGSILPACALHAGQRDRKDCRMAGSVEASGASRVIRRGHHGLARLGSRRAACRRWTRRWARSLRRDSLLLVDHRQPDLRRSQSGPAARWLRLSGSRQSRAAPCWPAPLSIASFWAARRRARPSSAPFWAA